MSTVNSLLYRQPLKPRVTIKDLEGNVNATFDAFGTKDFNLIYVDMENAIGDNGFFNIVIEDSEDVIPRELLENTKVILELGKQSSEYKFFLTGFAKKFHIRNPRSFYQEYLLSGYGSWKRADELFLQRREVPKDNRIWKLLENSYKNSSWRPSNDDSIEDLVGWSTAGISHEVDVPHKVVNEIYTRFKDWTNRLGDESGASIFLDYSFGEPERLTCMYNPGLHTGLTIKTGDQFVNNKSASGTRNSYIIDGPFEMQFDSSTDAGVNTGLYSVTILETEEVAKQTSTDGRTNLTSRAIAQQFQLTQDNKHINQISLRLEMDGEVDSPKQRVNGDIVLDNGGKPTGRVLTTFSIPLSDIEDHRTDVIIPDIDLEGESKLLSGTIKMWIRLFQRSGNDETVPGNSGDPNNDVKNTILWGHNNLFAQAQPDGLLSAEASGGDRENKDKLVWKINTQGPTYGFRIYANVRLLHRRVNPSAIKRLQLVEDFLDSSLIEDPADVTRFLAIALNYTSKTRLNIPEFRVSNPNDFLFRPYQWVTLIHPKYTGDIRVQRARYVCSALGGDRAIGALECYISLGGPYNTLIANPSCL